MKRKFSFMLIAIAILMMFSGNALAVSVSADYENGVVYWKGSDLGDDIFDVYVDGVFRDSITAGYPNGQWTKTFEPGTYTVTIKGASGTASTTFTVAEEKPTVAPTAEPTAVPTAEPTAVPTAEPTAVPTAEPTAVPTAEPTAVPTAEPTAVPTAKPTRAPVEDDPIDEDEADDVPKTGDNGVSYVVLIGAMALAVAYLASRRFARAK